MIPAGKSEGALALPVYFEANFRGGEARRGAAECEASALSAELTALSCGNAMKLFASLLVDYIIAISRTKSAGNGIDLPINKKQAASRVKSTS